MGNSIGKNITLTLFGESHGKYIGGTITNFPCGIKIDFNNINRALALRRPSGKGETSRIENDEYEFISGVFNGYTTGAPLTVLINNKNIDSSSYENIKDTPRPSHADYVANIKYDGFNDYRGGGHFSGRLTAVLVLFGAISKQILKEKYDIHVESHILQIDDIYDRHFENVDEDVIYLENANYQTLNDIKDKIDEKLEKISKNQDSIGGVVECAITNMKPGIGNPWFDSLEGNIANAMFSIPAIKGIEFGKGFSFATLKGSMANDKFLYENGKIITNTNNNGGINGGISNGMPIIFDVVIKPTPSISMPQNTINLNTKENTIINIDGRHDPCIVRRANIVVSSLTAFVILDNILGGK